jgi:hypothetical protein
MIRDFLLPPCKPTLPVSLDPDCHVAVLQDRLVVLAPWAHWAAPLESAASVMCENAPLGLRPVVPMSSSVFARFLTNRCHGIPPDTYTNPPTYERAP